MKNIQEKQNTTFEKIIAKDDYSKTNIDNYFKIYKKILKDKYNIFYNIPKYENDSLHLVIKNNGNLVAFCSISKNVKETKLQKNFNIKYESHIKNLSNYIEIRNFLILQPEYFKIMYDFIIENFPNKNLISICDKKRARLYKIKLCFKNTHVKDDIYIIYKNA